MKPAPTLFADARGVWFDLTPGRPSGIEWSEVYRITGYKLDGITITYTCVVLDFDYGGFIEMYHDWPGFAQVIAAITERMPGINPDWFQKIDQPGVGDPTVEVWHR
jgi:hypothetical protein